MRILFDARVLTAKPSGVRDIALGLTEGFRSLQNQGLVDFITIAQRQDPRIVFDKVIPSRLYMHNGLPSTASRLGADRILVPRQTRPLCSRVPTVPLFHDIGFFRAPNEYRDTWRIGATSRLAGRSKSILAVSKFTARELVEFGLTRRAHALPIQAIHEISWCPRTDEKYMLCIAVQEPHKNLVRLVKAWEKADTSDVKLVICGRPGHTSSELAALIASSEKSRSIELKSGLSDEDYKALLERCWAYIQPSLYEGLCIPALDLAAAGAPTAVSTLGNLGSVYAESPQNQIFDPYSLSEIVSSIESLLHDEGFRARSRSWNLDNVRLTNWPDVASSALDGMK